ncbi:Tn3 family transposase [Streptomyces sp. NPDC051636]|uniref:Tn3 family transposase n=1 Tax=Streptomyces sp. NPDC051636 TaxID=3365663 RepID=UPI0037888CDC
MKPDKILAGWTDRLDSAHQEFADGLAANPAVRIEQQGGRDRIILTGLDRLDEPASLRELHKEVEGRLPAVDLPEMVLEVDSWVPYLGDFTHVSEANSRMDDLELSVAAVLTAEATNVGVEPIVHDGVDAPRAPARPPRSPVDRVDLLGRVGRTAGAPGPAGGTGHRRGSRRRRVLGCVGAVEAPGPAHARAHRSRAVRDPPVRGGTLIGVPA